MKRKIAVIGASYLQVPLILKARDMGLETHVFAWAAGDPGETLADFFYPISIVEKESILEQCKTIGIDGICSIASDLAMVTVNYVADRMHLTANSLECTELSTNKHAMRKSFEAHGVPSPKSFLVESASDLDAVFLHYPVIVKPLDRSGSRGITKLETPEGLDQAIQRAKEQGFLKCALVEEYACGDEFSVECVSWQGQHTFLAITKKYTTGSPHFIETGHIQPAPMDSHMTETIQKVVCHALDSLKITYGASHTELKIDAEGNIRLIEIGARMGGDFIGSDLVELTTGVDFVKAVIQIALGQKPDICHSHSRTAAVRFVFGADDLLPLKQLEQEHSDYLVRKEIQDNCAGEVLDSSMRFGYYLLCADGQNDLLPYMPKEKE